MNVFRFLGLVTLGVILASIAQTRPRSRVRHRLPPTTPKPQIRPSGQGRAA